MRLTLVLSLVFSFATFASEPSLLAPDPVRTTTGANPAPWLMTGGGTTFVAGGSMIVASALMLRGASDLRRETVPIGILLVGSAFAISGAIAFLIGLDRLLPAQGVRF